MSIALKDITKILLIAAVFAGLAFSATIVFADMDDSGHPYYYIVPHTGNGCWPNQPAGSHICQARFGYQSCMSDAQEHCDEGWVTEVRDMYGQLCLICF